MASLSRRPTDLLEALRDVLARVAVIVCELELGETSVAYTVATDLEYDLEDVIAAADEMRRAA